MVGTNVNEPQAPDEDKFTELVLYVAKKIESDWRGDQDQQDPLLFRVRLRSIPWSSEEKGWQMVDDGEAIPYSAAYLAPTFQPTQAMRDHALELSSRLAKSL
jgi:hypothetical protein